MSTEEAYEKLGLAVGADLQAVRSKFNEMYNDFRMMIDNAPTPKLRESFERNLSELEDAFKTINGSETIDSLGDLPMMNQTRNTTNSAPETKKDLQTILAYFGFTNSTSAKEMKQKFNALTKSLNNEIGKQLLPQAKQIYQDELKKATDYWSVLLVEIPGLKKASPASSVDLSKYKKTFVIAGLIAGALIVAVLLFKSGVFSNAESLQEDFEQAKLLFNEGKLDEAETLFLELVEFEEMKVSAEPWLEAVKQKRQQLIDEYLVQYNEAINAGHYVDAIKYWNLMDKIKQITDPQMILGHMELEELVKEQENRIKNLISNGDAAMGRLDFDAAISYYKQAQSESPDSEDLESIIYNAETTKSKYVDCSKELERINAVMAFSDPSEELYKMAQNDLENIKSNCPGLVK